MQSRPKADGRGGWTKSVSRTFVAVCGLLLAAPNLAAQAQQLEKGPYRLEIALERLEEGAWNPVDPGLVFEPGERVRFRVKPSFGGFLYVMNQGTSGDYTTLFPRDDTGRENRIEPGNEYLIPSTDGAFRISGPAGHDVVYWMATPIAVAEPTRYRPLPPPPDSGPPPKNLLPRCDDTILRARGDCIDTSAGPQQAEALPQNFEGARSLEKRQLIFVQKEGSSVVSAPRTLEGPVVFEFRLAHR